MGNARYWFNLFGSFALAIVAGFALYFACGPAPGKVLLYGVAVLFGFGGVVINFAALMREAPGQEERARGHHH